MAENNQAVKLDMSKARLKVTLRSLNDLVESNPAMAEALKTPLGQIKTELTAETGTEAVEGAVESIELLKIDPAEFVASFASALSESLDARAEKREAQKAAKKAADEAVKQEVAKATK